MDTERNSSEGLSSKGGNKAGRKLVIFTNIKKRICEYKIANPTKNK